MSISTTTAYEREWSPVGLALSCVLAAFGLCLHADNQLLAVYALEGVAGLFACSFLIGVVSLCMAVLVSAHDEEQRRWSIGIGLFASIVGVGFALLTGLLPAAVCAAGSGLFLGFGLTCLLRQWGRYYRLFTHRGALLNTALSFLAAACWWFAMEFAGTPFLFCLGLLVLAVCGGLPLLAREIVLADEVRAGLRDDYVAPKPISTMSQAMRNGWAAVLGLMFNFFMIGATFWPYAGGLSATGISPKPLAYLLVFALVWWVVSRTREIVGGAMESFYRAALPCSALLLLAYPLLSSVDVLQGSIALQVISYLGVAVFNILGLVVLFWTAKSSEVGFSRVFAMFCTSCAASVAAGMVAFQLLGDGAQKIALLMLAVYVVVVLLAQVRARIVRSMAQ
ncbi:hypothetical protein C1879_08375 [Paraeggerthella hongkongensis]|uniref:hypothetical protein n=1 Tax=Paraeggerthella sp. TaxID=2897350 RepID=UPI000DF7C01E|nr:hypothetical protein C1879_08375 [Paraeggerthella hongkongensis]